MSNPIPLIPLPVEVQPIGLPNPTPHPPIPETRGGPTADDPGGDTSADPAEESSLPKHWHEAFRLRLAGEGVSEIAAKYGVDRTTIWRWIQRVEEEAANQLAIEPVFNIISREVARLTDLETQSRAAALNCPDDSKAKIGHLDQARRCQIARTSLLLRIGLIPSLPEKVFTVINDYRPVEIGAAENAAACLSRAEAIRILVETIQKTRTIG